MSELTKATFAAGCFWGVEKHFAGLDGVVETIVGYIGGHLAAPTYKDVCSGRSGHLEAVQVLFDSTRISYQKLLEEFWSIHDPTNPRGQGPDVGSQYLSVIFTHSSAQDRDARVSHEKESESGRYRRPLVTRIEVATHFWPAEAEHQKYLFSDPSNS